MALQRTISDPLGPLPTWGGRVGSPAPAATFSQQPSSPISSFGCVVLGIYLALHACAAPSVLAVYFGITIKFIAPMAIFVFILALAAGRLNRFFQVKMSLAYFFMLALWLLSAVIYSYKNEWVEMFQYSIRYHILPVLMCSLLTTTATLRRCMLLYTFGFTVTVLFCFVFGAPDSGGRFNLPETTLSNPNDLAFNLLFGVAHLMFLIRSKGFIKSLIAVTTIIASVYFVLRTGSRANLVVLLALLLTLFIISSMRARVAIVALSVLLAVGAIAVLPKQMLIRLTTFTSADEQDLTNDRYLEGALGSTEARKQLQRRAIIIALQNPVLGVGPGMYIYALNDLMVQQEKKAKGSWQAAHNTFLELAAETGMPAFLLYTGCLLWCVRSSLKSLKLLKSVRASDDAQALSLSLLLTSMTFIVGTLFCSISYTAEMPILIGFSVANWLVVRGEYLHDFGQQANARIASPRTMPLVPRISQPRAV